MKQKAIKLIHLVHTLSVGGLENGVVNIVNHLDPNRFQCMIYSLCQPDNLKDRVNNRCKLVVMNKRHGNDLATILKLARLFRKNQPTIVHTHAWGTLLEGFVATKLAKVPIFVHGEHGTMETRWRNIVIQRILWRLADQVLSVSEKHRHDLARKIGVPLSKIKTIPNGVDLDRLGPVRDTKALKRRFGIPGDNIVIGSVGRLVEVKQYHVLIEALSSLMKNKDRISGVLIGDGELREELERHACQLGIGGRVYFLGHQDNVAPLFQLLDIFVLTSRSEGMSNTILEAMASGLPVVATDVGGTSELVVDGETGFLVPPQDRIRIEKVLTSLILNREMRLRMGEKGRERAKSSFGIMRMVSNYEEFYLNLIAENLARLEEGKNLCTHNL